MNDIIIDRASKDGWNSPTVAALVHEVYRRRAANTWQARVTRVAWAVALFAATVTVAGYFLGEAVMGR